jgi:hypothetical protein
MSRRRFSMPARPAERHRPRREPIEVRKATLASILRKSRPGVRLNDHLDTLQVGPVRRTG